MDAMENNGLIINDGEINESINYGVQSMIPLRLTDLNGECLSALFKNLEINDLVILAKANLSNHEHLDKAFSVQTSATTHPYEASIRDHFVRLGYTDCVTNNPSCITFEKNVFQYFGRLITTARIYYDPKYQRHSAKIEQVIIKYGSALSEINLINADISAFEDIAEPLTKVTKLKFKDGWLGQKFCELQKWFPNLNSLTLYNTKISDHKFITQHPNLMKLSVKNKFLCQCDRMNRNVFASNVLDHVISNLHLRRFLNLNPQVKYLDLFHDREDAISELDVQPYQFLIQINFDLLKFIANTLPQLCHLKLNINEMRVLHLPTYLTTFSSSLKTLIVETTQTNQLIQLNIVCDALNRLEIHVDSPHQDYKLLSVFLSRFKSIESLTIGPHPVALEDDDLEFAVKNLTNLKILQLSLYKNIFFNDLCFIIKKFSRLHTVRVNCFEVAPEDRESFLKSINENYFLKGQDWKGFCIFNGFEFKKC